MTDNELFGISEQLESNHVADPGKMVGDLISRRSAIDAIMCEPTDAHYPSWYAGRLERLPSAQQIPWDRKTRNSMAGTLQMLRRLAYNIHGVMDVVDDDNVGRLIEWLEGGQDGTPRAVLSQKPVR